MNGSTVALPPGEEEINLRACWSVLIRRRALILSLVVVVPVVAACLTLLLPNIYQSTATLMPLGTSRGSLPTAVLGRGELGGFLPSGGMKRPFRCWIRRYPRSASTSRPGP